MGGHNGNLWKYDYTQLHRDTGDDNFTLDRGCNDHHVVYHASILFNFRANSGIFEEPLYRDYLPRINDRLNGMENEDEKE